MSEKSGFTLIELILVTVIIAILAGSVTVVFRGRTEQARFSRAMYDIQSYFSAVDLYALDHNDEFPDKLDDLQGRYVRKVKKDPWGNPYIYEKSKATYNVYSSGPDGQKGTPDDVTDESELSDFLQRMEQQQ